METQSDEEWEKGMIALFSNFRLFFLFSFSSSFFPYFSWFDWILISVKPGTLTRMQSPSARRTLEKIQVILKTYRAFHECFDLILMPVQPIPVDCWCLRNKCSKERSALSELVSYMGQTDERADKVFSIGSFWN